MENETAAEAETAAALARTENGALGFAGHRSAFADFFFKVSSMRQWSAARKREAFRKCLDANREMALRLLFFVRDIRGGCGERRLFRDIAPLLSDDEASVYKRGRNMSGGNVPKSATMSEYRSATGMEVLFGYLHLKGKHERISELFSAAYAKDQSEE